MWSTLPPAPPAEDLPLVDPDYNVKLLSASPCSPTFSFQQSVYAKLLAMRCSNRSRDLGTGSSKPRAPPSSLAAPSQQQQAADAQVGTFDVSPADEDRGMDYPQIDDIMTRSLQQRSNSIDQVLQGCGNNLSVPGQDYNCRQAGGGEDGRFSRNCSPTHRGSLRSGSGEQNSPESDRCEVNGESSKISPPQLNGPQSWDRSNSDPSRLGQSEACPIPRCMVSVRQEPEGSSETSSSYANISVELGTADLSEDFSSSHPNPSLQETDKEMQFSLSLDSNPASPNSDSQAKKEGEDEGYSGFFGSMKKLLASPKKRPADIVIPQEISSNQNSCSTTGSRDQATGEVLHRHGQSDSGLSEGVGEGEASSSWSSGQAMQAAKAPARPQPSFISLPPPQEFGNGNPFLMFLCLTLLLQHREQIVHSSMDYEDVAMLFDKMVRRHNISKVLHQARELYSDYLRTQQTLAEQRANEEEDYGLSV